MSNGQTLLNSYFFVKQIIDQLQILISQSIHKLLSRWLLISMLSLNKMRLKVITPIIVLIDRPVTKVIAEAENGHFCLLPNHIDFVAALVPGILSFTLETGKEVFVAVDEGILIKCGQEVLVSTRNAIEGKDLETLKQTVNEQFQALDEKEKLTRSALAQFEVSMMRRFMELGHG